LERWFARTSILAARDELSGEFRRDADRSKARREGREARGRREEQQRLFISLLLFFA